MERKATQPLALLVTEIPKKAGTQKLVLTIKKHFKVTRCATLNFLYYIIFAVYQNNPQGLYNSVVSNKTGI